MIRTAVIGMGNMGSRYAGLISSGKVPGMTLSAVTRASPERLTELGPEAAREITVFDSSDELLDSAASGKISLDAVIVATPHYSHEQIAVRAWRSGLHVLCEKPAGVYSRQARIMEEEAEKSGKVFAMMFQMRTSVCYRELRSIVLSGKYGKIKRVHWIVTNWYRPEGYYKTSKWHAAWATDGGGVLLNQCPHNLDILQWICGMPVRVQGFCHEGHYHDIEVEDDVTAYMEWKDGATGTFITSTGDAPAIDRLEIFMEEALIVCENGRVRIAELEPEMGQKESGYRKDSTDFFRTIKGTWHDVDLEKAVEDQYLKMLCGFASYLRGDDGQDPFIVSGSEGRKSLMLSNAIYLSSWEKTMIDIPEPGSYDELEFEKRFEDALKQKTEKSRLSSDR